MKYIIKSKKSNELHKDEYSHKNARPTEIAKLIFEFLKVTRSRISQYFWNYKTNSEIRIRTPNIGNDFDSVIAMKTVYCDDMNEASWLLHAFCFVIRWHSLILKNH